MESSWCNFVGKSYCLIYFVFFFIFQMQAKYDTSTEEQIRGFFQEQLGVQLEPLELGPNNLHKALKDGVKLCE